MSEVLTVPTSFGDIAELSSGLADRVDNDRIILYGPTPYEEGAEVGFAVLLLDGTPAIEGVGRVSAAVDGGEDRAPEIRYDIVFDNLQLDTRSEIVLERILIGRESELGEGQATGEVAVPEAEAPVDEAPVDEAPPEAVAEAAAEWDEAPADEGDLPAAEETEVAEAAEAEEPLAEEAASHGRISAVPAEPEVDLDATGPVDFGPPPVAASPPAMPAPPPGFEVSHVGKPALTRPTVESEWEPTALEREPSIPSSGLFVYSGALPIPARPPRPDLDPSLRVQSAPSPLSPSSPPPPRAPLEEVDAAAEAHEGELETERSDATGEFDVEELEELQ